MREQVRQLVPQGAVDFRFAVRAKPRIQEHEILLGKSPSRRASQPVRPFHFYMNSEHLRAQPDEKIARDRLEL
jgi:hypothetical protein